MRLSDPQYIVQDQYVLVSAQGVESTITVRVGVPYLAEGRWRCPAELQGVDGRYPDCSGFNSGQALSLALALIHQRLTHLVEDGNLLYFSGDRSATIDLNVLQSIFGR
jgi:hypothetical protein